MRTGTAKAPLHSGKCPRWLFHRMRKLSRAIIVHLIEEHGRAEVLRRLSDPVWFHAFGCVLGFDWNSSGVTTTVCGALKEGLTKISKEIGLFVCGGKGTHSRKTPHEIAEACDATGLDGEVLTQASRMAAKVDSACVQDGYELYHHTFLFTLEQQWAVVQQGLRQEDATARRYHWLGGPEELNRLHQALDGKTARIPEQLEFEFNMETRHTKRKEPAGISRIFPQVQSENAVAPYSFVHEPHAAVAGNRIAHRSILNLVAAEAEGNRKKSIDVAHQSPRDAMEAFAQLEDDALVLPRRHDVRIEDIDPSRLERILMKTYMHRPETFEALVALHGVGAKTLRALSLIAELLYEEPASFRDPARFAFAHGGKDGHPFPVDRTTYDEVLHHLGESVDASKIAHIEKSDSLKRLARWGRSRRIS